MLVLRSTDIRLGPGSDAVATRLLIHGCGVGLPDTPLLWILRDTNRRFAIMSASFEAGRFLSGDCVNLSSLADAKGDRDELKN